MNLTMKVIGPASDDSTPLVSKIEEAMRLGFNTSEGAKLVGIYDDGYRVIVALIVARDRHSDPNVRKEAHDWLRVVDEQNEIGRSHSLIKAFLMKAHKVGKKLNTWTKVKPRPDGLGIDDQLKLLLERPDLNDAVKKRMEELLASIVDEKIPSANYKEARRIVAAHKITKTQWIREVNKEASFMHALEHACQMCDNLTDVQRTVLSKENRRALISRLCAAAHALLEIQRELIEGEEGNGN